MLKSKGRSTRLIDAKGRRLIPGLNDSHLHAIRGGRFYSFELRWDGVPSLKVALDRVREQAKRTPKGQWIRVIGGWTPHQFAERRMPTPKELTLAAPDTPVYVLYLYSTAIVNRKGVEELGITKHSMAPAGGRYELGADGEPTGRLLAEPNPTILYQTLAELGEPSSEEKLSGTRHFYRELNRFGITSALDAGGGGHRFPAHYDGTARLAQTADMPVRISFHLFAQEPGAELKEFQDWVAAHEVQQNLAPTLAHGYELEGGGETLVTSAVDFENFRAPRPPLPERFRPELERVTNLLISKRWSLRIHATYDESASQILDVFESVDRTERDAGRLGFKSVRWAFDHGETLGGTSIGRIKALGGGVMVQNRMAFAGEDFIERYGRAMAAHAPPLRALLDAGVPVGAGTDATRVSSYNPWLALYWMVSGKSVGGAQLLDERNRLTRDEALHLYTLGSAWFSNEEEVKGRIAVGQFADFALLSHDYFAVPLETVRAIESVLTVVNGRVVYG
ncbi:MAG: amidohydrolase, partial [Anaerolineae bacterium]|nr:amidohydrolase [Gemmatimonadaceae bacterium]